MLEAEGSNQDAPEVCVEKGVLYLVAVPIGNLGDFTARALEVLSQVDEVACEEVQATRRLFNSKGLKARLVSYRESGRDSSGQRLLEDLRSGLAVAYVSGAGTPAISDPGRDLVERCHAQGIKVVPVPGASALTAAVAAAGLPCRRFVFEGFVPRNDGERRRYLESLSREERTMVFYEAPHRVLATVEAMAAAWGARRVFMGRELTKRFEECWLTDFSALTERLREEEPRGEFVLAVEGCAPASAAKDDSELLAQIDGDLLFLERWGLSAKTCAAILEHFRGLPPNKAKKLSLDFFSGK